MYPKCEKYLLSLIRLSVSVKRGMRQDIILRFVFNLDNTVVAEVHRENRMLILDIYEKSDYDQFWEFAQNRLLTKAVIIFIWNDESALFSSKLKLKIENVIENGSFIGQYTKDNSQRNRFVNISSTTITYLVPSLRWEFIMGTINLNVKRAPYMSSLFYLEPWLLDSNPNSIQ